MTWREQKGKGSDHSVPDFKSVRPLTFRPMGVYWDVCEYRDGKHSYMQGVQTFKKYSPGEKQESLRLHGKGNR